MNLATNLERSAFYFPDRPALSEDLSETSYAQLNERANQAATALIRMGVKPGDHAGLCAPNSGDWLAFYFGVLSFRHGPAARPHELLGAGGVYNR